LLLKGKPTSKERGNGCPLCCIAFQSNLHVDNFDIVLDGVARRKMNSIQTCRSGATDNPPQRPPNHSGTPATGRIHFNKCVLPYLFHNHLPTLSPKTIGSVNVVISLPLHNRTVSFNFYSPAYYKMLWQPGSQWADMASTGSTFMYSYPLPSSNSKPKVMSGEVSTTRTEELGGTKEDSWECRPTLVSQLQPPKELDYVQDTLLNPRGCRQVSSQQYINGEEQNEVRSTYH